MVSLHGVINRFLFLPNLERASKKCASLAFNTDGWRMCFQLGALEYHCNLAEMFAQNDSLYQLFHFPYQLRRAPLNSFP